MANSMDPDQTAPIGAVCSGFTLFASILNNVNNVRQFFAADNFSRRHFQIHFFLHALRVKTRNKRICLYLACPRLSPVCSSMDA